MKKPILLYIAGLLLMAVSGFLSHPQWTISAVCCAVAGITLISIAYWKRRGPKFREAARLYREHKQKSKK